MASPYHLNMAIISRSKGHSAVAGAAYQAREKLRDERTGEIYNYTRRKDLIYSEIFAPQDAPEWAKDRSDLWNLVESDERKNAWLGQNIRMAIPHQLDDKHREYLLKDFVHELTRKGLIVDVSVHASHEDGDPRNIHAHMQVSPYRLVSGEIERTEDGKKLRKYEWLKEKTALIELRDRWAKMGARQLERMDLTLEAERWRHGHETKDKQRTAALERGDLEFAQACAGDPTRHRGRVADQMERRGAAIDRDDHSAEEREIAAARAELRKLEQQERYLLGVMVRGKYDALRETHELVARQLEQAKQPDERQELAEVKAETTKRKPMSLDRETLERLRQEREEEAQRGDRERRQDYGRSLGL